MPTEDEFTPPDPPGSLPKYLREGAEKQDAETLRDLANYADALADYRERAAERELEANAVEDPPADWEGSAWSDHLDRAREKAELPPDRGTITVKRIDGRGYYYLQWRDGDTVKSQYVAPVTPAE